jgi:hypothetical protein
VIIYVSLLDEGTNVWCPVEAVHVRNDVYQIVEVNSDTENTRWAFETGAKVTCRPTLTNDRKETILVAYKQASE